MCGRYALIDAKRALNELVGLEGPFVPVSPHYNIAPTQNVLAIVQEDKVKTPLLRWGFVPVWAKDPSIGSRMINARAETLHEKPSFKGAFKNRRCLIPADGFYEWKREGKRSAPHFIRMKKGRSFAFAGLWEVWKDKTGNELRSCTIITTGPNDLMRPIHDRMPVILKKKDFGAWLDPGHQDIPALCNLLVPYPAQEMEAYPVSFAVNSPQNDGPECVKILAEKTP